METQILSKNLQIHSGQKKNKTGPKERSAKNKNKIERECTTKLKCNKIDM